MTTGNTFRENRARKDRAHAARRALPFGRLAALVAAAAVAHALCADASDGVEAAVGTRMRANVACEGGQGSNPSCAAVGTRPFGLGLGRAHGRGG